MADRHYMAGASCIRKLPAIVKPIVEHFASGGTMVGRETLVATLAALLLLAPAPVGQARQLALLVGIGAYAHSMIPNLEGPPNDVDALKKVLVQKWDFRSMNIRILVDAQATRQAILKGIDFLYQDSVPGDSILFYYSGHGTSRHDPQIRLPLPHGSGALTAWDSIPDGALERVMASLIVGRTDLKPRLERLDRGGRHVFVVLDACYSAYASRGLYRSLTAAPSALNLPTRQVPLRIARSLDLGRFDLGAYGTGRMAEPPPYPYRDVLTLSAASAKEAAQDIPNAQLGHWPTLDNRPHGAFTDALLRVLHGRLVADRNGDQQLSYRELRDTIADRLSASGFSHRPQLQPKAIEDQTHLAERGLFGRKAVTGPAEPSPVDIPDLAVRLDASSQGLATSLSTLSGVALVDQHAELIVTRNDDAWFIGNASGDKVGATPDDAGLIARIRQLAWFHRLSWRKEGKNPFGFAFEQTAPERGNINHLGERVSFDVRPERDSWLVILYADAKGDMALLYPWRREETTPIRDGRTVRVPADGSLRVRKPLGTDLIIALAYVERPPFLDRMVGTAALTPGDALYEEVMASLRDEGSVAVATLALYTAPICARAAGLENGNGHCEDLEQ